MATGKPDLVHPRGLRRDVNAARILGFLRAARTYLGAAMIASTKLPRILIVEDMPTTLLIPCKGLLLAGFAVEQVSTLWRPQPSPELTSSPA